MSPQQSQPTDGRRVIFRRIEQIALATVLLCAGVTLTGYWIWQGVVRNRLIEIDESPPLSAQFEVDINAAGWPELAQLPGIGETMARRIVEERATRGQYADYEDFERRVQGVGPRTMERIRPYLAPMPEVRNIAGNEPRPNSAGG